MRTRFRRVDERCGVLVAGPAGWGEFSPFPDYGPVYASRWLAAAHEAATRAWPAPVRDRIPVNVTVPAVDPRQAHDLVRRSGCRTAKVKVAEPGQRLSDDVARVEAVREALGSGGRIRVDANGAWDVDEAVRAIRALDRVGLEYVEQPVATCAEMALLRRRIAVPIAADEVVRTADDPLHVAGLDAADVVVIKVQPLGGVWPALEVATAADAAGLSVVVSSALETSIGLAAGVALAAALPRLPYACGLATAALLDGDVVRDPLLPEAGTIVVRRPSPDPDLLRRWAPSRDQARGLLRRLETCAAIMATTDGSGATALAAEDDR
ncbi:MAG: o-succinylbenzoate synthase [Actinomycetota bacterium]|nr:o-succinylbenzoate synthase [Actinomycetota bacterium]